MKYLILLLLSIQAHAVTLPYTFSTSLPPSQINANFDTLRDAINAHEALNINSNFIIENLASDPVCDTPSTGRIIFNTTQGILKVCDGTNFITTSTNHKDEIPAGSINNSNVTFSITFAPLSGSFKLYLDGIRLRNLVDYTISGTTITMIIVPNFGQTLDSDYSY